MFRKNSIKSSMSILILLIMIILSGCVKSGGKDVYEQTKSEIEDIDYSKSTSETEETDKKEEVRAKELSGNLTVTTYSDLAIEPLANDFMKMYPDVHITINQYYDPDNENQNTYESYITYAVTALMGGSADDLIDISSLPKHKLAESGVLVDLLEMLKSDTEFNTEDYYWNVIKPLILQDKLYYIPTGFGYDFIRMNKEALEKARISEDALEKADYEHIIELYNKVVTDGVYDTQYFLPFQNAYKVSFNNYELNIYMNDEKKTADFMNEEFIKYIELCKNMPSEKHIVGELYSIVGSGGGFPKDYSYMKDKYFAEISNKWEDALFELLPIPDMPITQPQPIIRSDGNNPYLFFNAYSISQNSKVKELAWEFLKYCISEKQYSDAEMYNHLNEYSLIPVNKKNFKLYFDFTLNRNLTNIKRKMPDVTVDEEVFRKDAYETFDQWNKERNCVMMLDSDVDTIISQVLEQYFYNDASLEETLDQLQKRVDMYFQE